MILSARESFSRWILKGIPLLVGFGILSGFALRTVFGLSPARLALPITVLVAIQAAFFMGMYVARKRYKQSRDLRAGFILTGMYCLLIGLVGFHYAQQLGIVSIKRPEENYLEFSIYMLIVIGSGIAALSLKKFARSR